MRAFYLCAALALLRSSASAADDKKPPKPCTIKSQTTGSFFDLNPINLKAPEDRENPAKDERTESWHAKGYDYGSNFTLNFCGPVVEELKDVDGVDESLWKNVSAYYIKDGTTYSLGINNYEPVLRGRKLILNYTDGSPCKSKVSRRSEPLNMREIVGDDDDDEDKDKDKKKDDKDKDKDDDKDKDKDEKKDKNREKGEQRKKSAIISLLCENDPMSAGATVSFVAASEDECSYYFEARSHAGCGGVERESQNLGPGGVFSVICIIAIMVYVIGGCVYQRTVMHQRGWRQLPNYSLWMGIWSFARDIFIIFTDSCSRLIPRSRGYNRISLNGDRRGRGHHSDDENRLIDQLDEEWDD